MKRIRIDAEGDAALEELDDATERQDNGEEPADQEPENTKPSNKKVYIPSFAFLITKCLLVYLLSLPWC